MVSLFLTACSGLPTARENIPAAKNNIVLGLAYLKRKDSALAKAKLLKALQDAPHYSLAYDAYGYFLEKSGELQLAEQYYLRAIGLANATDKGSDYNNYGTYLYRCGRFKDALHYFQLAAKDPLYLNVKKAKCNSRKAELKLARSSYFDKS